MFTPRAHRRARAVKLLNDASFFLFYTSPSEAPADLVRLAV